MPIFQRKKGDEESRMKSPSSIDCSSPLARSATPTTDHSTVLASFFVINNSAHTEKAVTDTQQTQQRKRGGKKLTFTHTSTSRSAFRSIESGGQSGEGVPPLRNETRQRGTKCTTTHMVRIMGIEEVIRTKSEPKRRASRNRNDIGRTKKRCNKDSLRKARDNKRSTGKMRDTTGRDGELLGSNPKKDSKRTRTSPYTHTRSTKRDPA